MTRITSSRAATRFGKPAGGLLLALLVGLPGCVTGIPARRLPADFLGETRADATPIDMVRLRQDPPDAYKIDARDILGVYIEGVLGTSENAVPPVQNPERGGLPPSIGFPIVVREDGTVSLPLIDPVKVSGTTVAEAEKMIREEYTVKRAILPKGKDRIIVTLMRRRSYQVVVVREDASGTQNASTMNSNLNALPGQPFLLGTSKKGSVYSIDLPAYENDVLHALAASGGLPGLDAKNEIQIRRGQFKSAESRDQFLASLKSQANLNPCCPIPPAPPEDPNVTTIPLRYRPGQVIRFKQDDIILKNGDVIYIPANPADFFYTGGLLNGGQFQLPRDTDIDVLGAIAMARGPIGNNQQGSSGGSLGNILPATEVIVVRTTKCGGQIPIRIDLNKALTNSRERLIIQPGDIVILQYTPLERIGNAILSTVSFNFLFNGFNGRGF